MLRQESACWICGSGPWPPPWVPSFELKAGRQILTWGTGDLLFINDLFPKDWQALLTGRPVNYLKAPSNSIKLSNYNRWLTIDLVYTPLFTPDRFVNGSIVEYYDPLSGGTSGASASSGRFRGKRWFRNGEWAIRLHKNVKGIEYDIYGYHGYWKTPEGFTAQGQYFFPELSVLGASVRVPLFAGIFSVEYGHYFSAGQEAEAGTPIRGPEDRWLVGFEKEVAKDFTLRGQFYLEYINNYEEYLANFGSFAFREEWRTLLSLRVEYLTWEQKLRLSLVNFYSPADRDAYLKSSIFYKPSDDLQLEDRYQFICRCQRFLFFRPVYNEQ